MIANLVFQTSLSIGSSDIVLATANGWRSFATTFGSGEENLFKYTIRHTTEPEYEIGVGYIVAATSYMHRESIIESSNGNLAVNFSAGKKEVSHSVDALFIESLANPVPAATILDANGTIEDITSKFNDLLAKLKAMNLLES